VLTGAGRAAAVGRAWVGRVPERHPAAASPLAGHGMANRGTRTVGPGTTVAKLPRRVTGIVPSRPPGRDP